MRAVAEGRASQAKSPSCIDFGGRRPLKTSAESRWGKINRSGRRSALPGSQRGEVWNVNEKARQGEADKVEPISKKLHRWKRLHTETECAHNNLVCA